jgi:sulfur carrier protein
VLNGAWREVAASQPQPGAATLAALLQELGFGNAVIATAVNGEFVPQAARAGTSVRDGDRIEVLSPMQGG